MCVLTNTTVRYSSFQFTKLTCETLLKQPLNLASNSFFFNLVCLWVQFQLVWNYKDVFWTINFESLLQYLSKTLPESLTWMNKLPTKVYFIFFFKLGSVLHIIQHTDMFTKHFFFVNQLFCLTSDPGRVLEKYCKGLSE